MKEQNGNKVTKVDKVFLKDDNENSKQQSIDILYYLKGDAKVL